MTTRDPWIRNGIVIGVIDGDTVKVDIDLGFYVSHRTNVRLLGVNTPERGAVTWAAARDGLSELLLPGSQCTVVTTKADKYGNRWDGRISTPSCPDVSQAMIDAGLGVPYAGGAR